MATGGEESGSNKAFETFRKHCAELLTAIQDPEVLVWELFAEGVVTDSAIDKVSSSCVPASEIKQPLKPCNFSPE